MMQSTAPEFGQKVRALAALVFAIALVGYGGYRYLLLFQKLQDEQVLSAVTASKLEQKIIGLEFALSEAVRENAGLADALRSEEKRNNDLDAQVQSIAATVGALDKLSKTDRELLRKYSKIYFLSENYVPGTLMLIDPKYGLDSGVPLQIHTNVSPYLVKLMDAALAGGVDIKIISAYRSFGTQASVKSSHTFIYGAETANKFSADQGYSEHQLGTTVDFTTQKAGAANFEFNATGAYSWLKKNAHIYGFTLSYPAGNAYYAFEPWHWRFVGTALATKLFSDGTFFYDLPQREIDEYLINLFD